MCHLSFAPAIFEFGQSIFVRTAGDGIKCDPHREKVHADDCWNKDQGKISNHSNRLRRRATFNRR